MPCTNLLPEGDQLTASVIGGLALPVVQWCIAWASPSRLHCSMAQTGMCKICHSKGAFKAKGWSEIQCRQVSYTMRQMLAERNCQATQTQKWGKGTQRADWNVYLMSWVRLQWQFKNVSFLFLADINGSWPSLAQVPLILMGFSYDLGHNPINWNVETTFLSC